jgi:hypothetical protein
MRLFALVLVVLGGCLAAEAGYDEYRGITTKPAGPWGARSPGSHNGSYLNSIQVIRGNNPGLFQEFIMAHWAYAFLIGTSGCVLYVKNKPDNRAD